MNEQTIAFQETQAAFLNALLLHINDQLLAKDIISKNMHQECAAQLLLDTGEEPAAPRIA